MEDLRPPKSSSAETQLKSSDGAQQRNKLSLNPPLLEQSCDPHQLRGRKTKNEQGKQLVGPACDGPSIEDLFLHSFSPPPVRTKPQSPTSRWAWVVAARVWDSEVEQLPASAADIRKFGAQAKRLRRVQPSTTDGRSFVEVTKKQMEKRVSGS